MFVLSKNRAGRDAFVLLTIIVFASCALTSCYRLADSTQQKALGKPSSHPVSRSKELVTCGFLNYTGQTGDENDTNDHRCFNLQEKLIKGALAGKIEELKAALQEGAHLEGTSYDRYPALHSAAMKGKNDAVEFLLDSGAQVNRVVNFERTPLNMAAANGHKAVVMSLVKKGADTCYKSSAGTAGDIAFSENHKEISALLKALEKTKCPP